MGHGIDVDCDAGIATGIAGRDATGGGGNRARDKRQTGGQQIGQHHVVGGRVGARQVLYGDGVSDDVTGIGNSRRHRFLNVELGLDDIDRYGVRNRARAKIQRGGVDQHVGIGIGRHVDHQRRDLDHDLVAGVGDVIGVVQDRAEAEHHAVVDSVAGEIRIARHAAGANGEADTTEVAATGRA